MNGLTHKVVLVTLACIGVTLLSGCVSTKGNLSSGAELTAAEPVVFGKFRLVRNGVEANINGGIFSGTATLKLFHVDGQQEIAGKVGENGEFAWALEPGDYRVTSIAFSNRGVRAEPETDFGFTVKEGQDAIYVGTVTLEATIDSGYYGINGVVDNLTVSDDCAVDCNRILERLGLEEGVEQIALLRKEDGTAGIQ